MARDAVRELHETAEERLLRATEKPPVGACLAAADHARKRDHQHFMGSHCWCGGSSTPSKIPYEVLHCPASGRCFPTTNHTGTQKPRGTLHGTPSNAIALPDRRFGLDGCLRPCQALAHLSPGPLTGASHRGLSPGPLTGASHRGLSPGPLTGASHRGLSPGPLTGASHRGLSPGPLTGASHRGLSPGPLTGASHRGLSPGPLTGASHRGLSPGPLTGASHRGLSPGPLDDV